MNHLMRFWLKPGLFMLLTAVMLFSAAAGLTAQAAAPTPPTAPLAGDAALLPSNYVISVDSEMKALFTLNTSTNQVYGPFLFKQLGDVTPTEYALRDIEVTPDAKPR
ncbi:MAG TPA: hypothetical protein PKW33_17075 [Anaerolineaceae bacterium]|nr:hypothetical protein [Anaerolineaceae bacterium]HPN53312.1 hypothetical protein [Anaerolineaceae bacterium]